MSKKLKCAFLTFAIAGVVATSAAMTGCTIKTNHPRAKITISFNQQEYEIEYTMYRNMYPQTVQHFIELADAGFYNDTIIHDYKANDWSCGGYNYNKEIVNGTEIIKTDYIESYSNTALKEYLENNSKEAEYYDLFKNGTFTPSVFKKITYNEKNEEQVVDEDALATLIGEFTENDHNIEKGALSATYGTLKMTYYDKGSSNQQVAIRDSFGDILTHDYKYNCATSIFAMQVGNSTSYSASKYCVFAELSGDSARKSLQKLTDDISDYVSKTSSFSTSVTTNVDTHDTFAETGGREIEQTFTMTRMPLIITSVEITKY